VDSLTPVKEIIAIAGGALIGLAPLALRYLFGRKGPLGKSAGEKGRSAMVRGTPGPAAASSGKAAPRKPSEAAAETPKPMFNESQWMNRIKYAAADYEPVESTAVIVEAADQGVETSEPEGLVEMKSLSETSFRGWEDVRLVEPGWERIERLPRLQKAVVLAEILGPPPALKGPRIPEH